MQPTKSIHALLQMAGHPAFCVSDGVITAANDAALSHLIPVGAKIQDLLTTGKPEYDEFTQGRLCLTLTVSGTEYDASVQIVEGFHIFSLESEYADSHLQLLSLAAQQLRNPLSSVKAMMDHLLPELETEGNPTAATQLSYLYRSLNQMQRIIYNMSDTGRYTSTPAKMTMRDVDAVLRELFESAGTLCEHSGITLRYTGTDTALYSLIDYERLERCIYNILSNAIKHTPVGGTIQAQLTRKGNQMLLTVQDSGNGIDPENPGDLYHRYLREPGLESMSQGLGLGLPLIHACARSHGGAVLLSSTPQGLRLTMSMQIRTDTAMASPSIHFDYAGEQDHGLIELSDVLPPELYDPIKH